MNDHPDVLIPEDEVGLALRKGTSAVTLTRNQALTVRDCHLLDDFLGSVLHVRRPPAGTFGELYDKLTEEIARIKDPLWQSIKWEMKQSTNLDIGFPSDRMHITQPQWSCLTRWANRQWKVDLRGKNRPRGVTFGHFYTMLKKEAEASQSAQSEG